MNAEIWDRIAQRQGSDDVDDIPDTVMYAPGGPTEADLRLCGDVTGKRVLDLGSGNGKNAIALARQGAHVIAIDRSIAQLTRARKLAATTDVRVEWHECDASDLAFLRADSIDLVLAAAVLGEVEDIDRLFRQVHRVLRPGASFVFSYDHPMALALGRESDAPGALPLGALEVRRSYFDMTPVEITHDDERIKVWPRTTADVFASAHRAGYRVELLLEPEPDGRGEPGPEIPRVIVWRARKEGF
ncbi:MAG TPA: class I SAM-dependent methyltransferase [Acidimicrobiia bacterium]|nr:class I SAM-dependent methyltransferase [Acidimicrobiia bacterium]